MTDDDLAARVQQLTAKWGLALDERYGHGLPGNHVASATRLVDGQPCVLKVTADCAEARAEAAALAHWNGHGAARLLDVNLDAGGLLLEKVLPGDMLTQIARTDDAEATSIAAKLLGALWRPATRVDGLVPLERWCAAYERNRVALSDGALDFPADLFRRADQLCHELLASTRDPVVLHGDLHHFNILRSGRAGWLAIDPKGLSGDRGFDVCQFLMNPGPVLVSVNRRRLDIFCAELHLDPVRTRQWCLVHAVLNACWGFEDGHDVATRVAYAQQMLEL